MSNPPDNNFDWRLCKKIEVSNFVFQSAEHQDAKNLNSNENDILKVKDCIEKEILKCVKGSVFMGCIHDQFCNPLDFASGKSVNESVVGVDDDEMTKMSKRDILDSASNSILQNDLTKKMRSEENTDSRTLINDPFNFSISSHKPTAINEQTIAATIPGERIISIDLNDEQKLEIHKKMKYMLDEEDICYMKMLHEQLTRPNLDSKDIENKANEWNVSSEEIQECSNVFQQFEWVDKHVPKLIKTEDFLRERYVEMLFEAWLSDETKNKLKQCEKLTPSIMKNNERVLYSFLCKSSGKLLMADQNDSNKKCNRLKSFNELREEKKLRSNNNNYRNEAANQIVKFLLAQRSTLKSNSVVTANNVFTQLASYRMNKSKTRKSGKANYQDDHSVQSRYYNMKAVKTNLVFSKSTIHNWGLFATEKIPKNEMIVEYTGEKIRNSVADHRERCSGPDASSYFFRLDSEWVIDATNCGNYARFINHSCDPNCYAEIVEIDNAGKIIIFSKREIQAGEELTYDYNFPLEDEKIPCCCGSTNCRGSLN